MLLGCINMLLQSLDINAAQSIDKGWAQCEPASMTTCAMAQRKGNTGEE
jgi:hypothetical protein